VFGFSTKKPADSGTQQTDPDLGPLLKLLRKMFVSSATWSPEGRLTGVSFFSPEQVLSAAKQEALAQAAQPDAPGGSLWDETPDMKRVRRAVEQSKTAEERAHHAAKYEQLLREQVMYHSS
jgi:hypothetical protein